jgi:vacuolar-type H+-ATPase subunit C/Vma6
MRRSAQQFVNVDRWILVPLFFYDEAGQRQSEEFAVVYRATASILRELVKLADEKRDSMVQVLAQLIVSIPDIEDEGKPIEITPAVLDGFHYENIHALYSAIMADMHPTQAPTMPLDSPSTFEAETAAQN